MQTTQFSRTVLDCRIKRRVPSFFIPAKPDVVRDQTIAGSAIYVRGG